MEKSSPKIIADHFVETDVSWMSPGKQILITTLYTIVLGLILGPILFYFQTWLGLCAVAISLGSCWLGMVFATISIIFFRYALKKELPWYIMGTLFRMGIPLLTALLVGLFTKKDLGISVLLLFPVIYLSMLPVIVFMMLPEKPYCFTHDREKRSS